MVVRQATQFSVPRSLLYERTNERLKSKKLSRFEMSGFAFEGFPKGKNRAMRVCSVGCRLGSMALLTCCSIVEHDDKRNAKNGNASTQSAFLVIKFLSQNATVCSVTNSICNNARRYCVR